MCDCCSLLALLCSFASKQVCALQVLSEASGARDAFACFSLAPVSRHAIMDYGASVWNMFESDSG